MASHSPDLPEPRFHELDILRGVAALMVVIFHYKHFVFISDILGFDTAHLPFSVVLEPVYIYGQFFVELFFSISGYVFFWLYGTAIADRHVNTTSFVIARFARLYPLYVVTLLIVAVGQILFHARYGADFIYHADTPQTFVLNLAMVQQWLPFAQMSFNGPAWSISVEVFLYAVFFLICRWRWNNPLVLAGVVVLSIVFHHVFHEAYSDFARGMPNFFIGGLLWYAVKALDARPPWRRRVVMALGFALPVLWVLAYVVAQPWWLPVTAALDARHIYVFDYVLSESGFVYVVLPLSLLLVCLLRGRTPRPLLERFAWLGDISYSLYLWHFPLQLTIMLVMARYSPLVRTAVFGSPVSFVVFLAVACGLAWLSYRWFEMPARRGLKVFLNRHLARRPALR